MESYMCLSAALADTQVHPKRLILLSLRLRVLLAAGPGFFGTRTCSPWIGWAGI